MIRNIAIMPPFIACPWNKGMMIVSFQYKRHGGLTASERVVNEIWGAWNSVAPEDMRIKKITETDWITSHFKELISLS